MPTTDTPLRYPGGKSQLTPLILDLLKANDLFYGEYAEPFAGGAGIAVKLLLNGYVHRIYLNDFDPSIYAFWHSLLNDTDAFCEMIEGVDVTMDEWHRQRHIYFSDTQNKLERGFSALFLNRTNRSGILKAGVIGGLKQEGAYKLDCRFNKKGLIHKVRRIANKADQVELSNLDAVEFIETILPGTAKNTLVNLDPPYFKRGQELYTNAYDPDDHADLAKRVKRLKRRWIVTYDDAEEIRALYKKFPMFSNKLNYSAQVKRVGTELLIADPRLNLPEELMEIAI